MMNTRTGITNTASPEVRFETRVKRNRARARFRGEEGQSLVEFALVLPILLIIVWGVVVFGIAINQYLTLTFATDNSVQLLAISRGQTTDPCNLTATTFYGAAPGLTQANLTFTIVLDGTNVGGKTCSSGSTTTGAAADLVAGTPASVTVSYPCNLTIFGINFAPSGCTLTAQTSEDIQ